MPHKSTNDSLLLLGNMLQRSNGDFSFMNICYEYSYINNVIYGSVLYAFHCKIMKNYIMPFWSTERHIILVYVALAQSQ